LIRRTKWIDNYIHTLGYFQGATWGSTSVAITECGLQAAATAMCGLRKWNAARPSQHSSTSDLCNSLTVIILRLTASWSIYGNPSSPRAGLILPGEGPVGSLLISLHIQEARYAPEIERGQPEFFRRYRGATSRSKTSLRYGSGFELTGITESESRSVKPF
jgi:hypothetical protein